MNCQNCHELLEEGAAFCGNCGYPVQPAPAAPVVAPTVAPPAPVGQNQQAAVPTTPTPPSPSAPLPAAPAAINPTAQVPSYAHTTPSQHQGETPALLAVIFGVIGIAGAGLFIPIIGLVFGVAGLCMGTVSRRRSCRRLALIGLVIASLAIVAGFAALVWNLEHNKSGNQTGQSTTASKVLAKLSTPCYSFNLIDAYNISNTSGSCDATIFNGQSFGTSTDIYKIVATKTSATDSGSFTAVAKQAVDDDIQNNLPGFTITSQGPSSFAGSLAYTVYADNKSQDTVVVETGVLHQSSKGDNAFDILHAINGTSVNLQSLETQWQWK